MFRGDISARYQWLYKENPHGEAASWLAYDEQGADPVAVTSLFPRRVAVGGKQRLGSIGGDCYVVPRARRKGLATSLHRACIAQMRDAGIEFMYGPPLPNNLKALVKAGAVEVGTYQRFTKFLTGSSLTKRFLPKSPKLLGGVVNVPMRIFDGATSFLGRGMSLRRIFEISEEFDVLENWNKEAEEICPIRDRDFLHWRYIVPGLSQMYVFEVRQGEEFVGFAAMELDGKEAVVVDVFCRSAAQASGALALLAKEAKKLGCSTLNHYGTERSSPRGSLRTLGFFAREERGFQVTLSPNEDQRDLLLNPTAWRFGEGEKDSPTSFSSRPV